MGKENYVTIEPPYFHIGALIFAAIAIIWLKIEQSKIKPQPTTTRKTIKDIRRWDLETNYKKKYT